MIFVLILIILLVFIYLFNLNLNLNLNENFVSCNRTPSGPYKTKCTNIDYNNGILSALCPKQEPENTFEFSKLVLANCVKDSNDCDSINVNSQGLLICE